MGVGCFLFLMKILKGVSVGWVCREFYLVWGWVGLDFILLKKDYFSQKNKIKK